MSNLITREETQKALYGCVMPNKYAEDILAEVPPADIIECARAIKEYCEKYDEHCVGCPFNSAKPTKWCELGCSSLPYEWNLPEGEKK